MNNLTQVARTSASMALPQLDLTQFDAALDQRLTAIRGCTEKRSSAYRAAEAIYAAAIREAVDTLSSEVAPALSDYRASIASLRDTHPRFIQLAKAEIANASASAGAQFGVDHSINVTVDDVAEEQYRIAFSSFCFGYCFRQLFRLEVL